jgi:hypothetical protein
VRWEQLPINSTFDRARRKEVYRRLAGVVRRSDDDNELLPLERLREHVRLFEQTYVGVRAIPVAAIVGTAGRSEDFSEDFLPRRDDVRERWMRIERAFPDGMFPPIVAYRLGDSYFVVDGHHRVAVAKQRKIEFIDAEITELRARFALPPGVDVGSLIHAEQRQRFMEDSGLDRKAPEVDIDLSAPHEYIELLELIKVHAYHLSCERDAVVPIEDAAIHFYDHVYLPTVDAIREEGLGEVFPHKTSSDLFMVVYERRRTLFPERGSVELVDVVRDSPPPQRRSRLRNVGGRN